MVDPGTAMLLSGGMSMLGGLFGDDNSAQNALIAQQNAEERRTNRLREALSQRMLDAQLAPVTTASGSRSSYTPGEGYKTELSPLEQTILNANLQRMMQEGAGENATRAYEADTGAQRRMDAGADATAFRRERNAPPTRSVDSILGDLLLSRRRNVNEQFDDVGSAVSTQALRSGNFNDLTDLARGRSDALQASSPSRTEATNILDQLMNSRRSNSTQLQVSQEGLARRGETPAMPMQMGADGVTNALRSTAPQGFGVAMSGIQAPRFTMPLHENKTSNMLNSGASALFGYGQYVAGQEREDKLLGLLAGRQKGNT